VLAFKSSKLTGGLRTKPVGNRGCLLSTFSCSVRRGISILSLAWLKSSIPIPLEGFYKLYQAADAYAGGAFGDPALVFFHPG